MLLEETPKELDTISSVDLCKFFGALSMITCHCFIFLFRYLPEARHIHIPASVNPYFLLPGFASLVIPAAAGWSFREFLTPFIYEGRLLNFPIKKIIPLLLGVGLVDFIKNGFIFGMVNAFKWDVLPFLALSLLLILLVVKARSVLSLVGLVFATLAATAWLQILNIRLELDPRVLSYLGSLSSNDLIFSCAIVLTLISLVVVRAYRFGKAPLKLEIKILLGVLATVFLVLVTHTLSEFPFLFISILKLPLSSFIQLGQGGGHIWPLFPWFSLVATGFIMRHYRPYFRRHWKLSLAIYVAAQIVFNICYFMFMSSYQSGITTRDFLSSEFFRPRLEVIVVLLSFFISAMIGYEWITLKFPFKSKIIKMYSEGILFFYVLHLAVAWFLLPGMIRLIPNNFIYYMYPSVVLVVSFCFFAGFYPLLSRKILLNIRKF